MFRRKPKPQSPPPNIKRFLSALAKSAVQLSPTTYVFARPDGAPRGFVQIKHPSGESIQIHRIWVLHSGNNHGSSILRGLCDLADDHNVSIRLKAIPFGEKPYPMSRAQLRAWYHRHGFHGPANDLKREPRAVAHRK